MNYDNTKEVIEANFNKLEAGHFDASEAERNILAHLWQVKLGHVEEIKEAEQALLNNLSFCDNCYEDNRDFLEELLICLVR